MSQTSPPLLRLQAIAKNFPGVKALQRVHLEVNRGEIVAIVGENGAGKSTLLKVLGGIHAADEGDIFIDGERQRFDGVRDSMQCGIALIHQELNLADNISIGENIFLGRYPSRGPRWLSLTDKASLYQRAAELLQMVGLRVEPHTLVARLSVGQQQLVEIAKALSAKARILVFDEPTSSLTLTEAERLLALVERLREQGTAILYVTHRLAEVTRLADRVIVLRDGEHVGTLRGEEITEPRLISLMVGRDLEALFHQKSEHAKPGVPALDVHDLQHDNAAGPISFSIQPGEIVGFAGIVGAGRSELAKALFGVDRQRGGEIRVHGEVTQIRTPRDAIRARIALVPEDRKLLGLILPMAIRINISLASLPQASWLGWLNRRDERRLTRELMERLAIRAKHSEQRVLELSGGNQQKVALAKWLALAPSVLILDEPTRGVDVGAKQEIYRLMRQAAERGMGIMMISSEMEEIVGVADRVLVMREGRIVGELLDEAINEQNVLRLAVGAAQGTAA
ncbi:MAG: sugar ABC transporter ATP-binding protein [Pirellulales bacterium]